MTPALDRFFATATRYLHLDKGVDTAFNLIWVLSAALLAIVVYLLADKFYNARIARLTAAVASDPAAPRAPNIWQRMTLRCLPMIAPLANSLFATLGVIVLREIGHDPALIIALKPLFMAWTLITAIYVITHSHGKTAFVAVLVLPLSLPFMLPYIHAFEQMLDDLSFTIGKTTITAFMVTKLLIISILLMWIAGGIKDGVNASLSRLNHLRWSTRQLLQNLSSIGIYVVAILVALSLLGIDLTAFAVLGGAIGVGIGLGLQKIASNFISGLILLSEQAIQVNDMIEVAGSGLSGLVRHTGARYTMIETADRREVMIPNDDLITNRVVNWTYSNTRGTLAFDVGVSYGSDLTLVRDILLEITRSHAEVLKTPPPSCLLKEFGASTVVFTVTVQLEFMPDRRNIVRSELLFDIWAQFKDKGIELPYPQMTIHQAPRTDTDSTKDS